MSSWFRRDNSGLDGDNPDDCPTGQIPAVVIAAADRGSTGPVRTDPDQLAADRQALIQLCLYALDRSSSGGVLERLEEGLAGVGVTALRPDGSRFDPVVHEAGGAVPTEDAALDGMVAETEVAGFRDGDRILRAPVVTVYSAAKGARS